MRNLELAFPEWEQGRRQRTGRDSLASLFTTFLEILTLRHLGDSSLERILVIDGIELLRSIGERGALLLSAHVGNWELLAFGAAARAGVPFTIVVKDQKDGGELNRTRTSRGNGVIPTARAAREVTAILRKGGVVAMLADQSAADHEHLVPMFSIPTYTYSAPARLALRYRPKVIVGFAVRQQNGTYRVKLEEIRHDDLPDTPGGALELTRRYVAALEATIRRHPEQWVWQHRKWKNTPGISYD